MLFNFDVLRHLICYISFDFIQGTDCLVYGMAKTIFSLLILVGGFIGLTGWFGNADIFHLHFFDHGTSILLYNFSRMLFIFFILWVVVVTGSGVIYLAEPDVMQELSLTEWLVFSFATGIGIWHLLMLMLGLMNLYYQPVIAGLCATICCFSVWQFRRVMQQIYLKLQTSKLSSLIMWLLIGLALGWLLVTRGLYPGGSGDYYNHYSKYYLAVINNHGLAPNDVWYHFYYTKGSGLDFLAILLMDPQAPEIVTFCYVTMAALAIFSLARRLIPNSLWPLFIILTYIFYYLYSGYEIGGDFQKLHEKTSSLVVICAFAICMYNKEAKLRVPALVAASSVSIAAATITQATALLLAACFFAAASVAMLQKNFRKMKDYALLCGVAGGAVASIFLLNYLVTGLATDQLLELSWRFANVEQLNQWGVIPNVLLAAWERQAYAVMVEPYGWNTLYQLGSFLRLDRLWLPLISAFVALIIYSMCRAMDKGKSEITNSKSLLFARDTLFQLSLFIASLALLSVVAGHVQAVSYLRFSSFFLPLVLLFIVSCWALLALQWQLQAVNWIIRVVIPVVLMGLLLSSWGDWYKQSVAVTKTSLHFLTGKFSLADAYTHPHQQETSFGAINPAVLAAAQQLPPRTRIWSMNGNAHCVAPVCRIESFMSFKLSSRMQDILIASPETARTILHGEGLDYFLYANDFDLLDLLAYSPLFNPETLTKYFVIKWTDGKTFLLTWRGSEPSNINQKFQKSFSDSLNKPRPNWFNFKNSLVQINLFMKQVTSGPHPWRPAKFPPMPN